MVRIKPAASLTGKKNTGTRIMPRATCMNTGAIEAQAYKSSSQDGNCSLTSISPFSSDV